MKKEKRRRYAVTVLVDVRALTEAGFRDAERHMRDGSFDGWAAGDDGAGRSVTHRRSSLKRVKVVEVKR